MNKNKTNTRMLPRHLITVYADKHGQEFYLERREIRQIGKNYSILAPTPLSDDILRGIANSYMKANSYDMDFGGIVPEHIIYASNTAGNTVVIWYRKAMSRALNFSSKLSIKGASEVQVPATLGVIKNKEMFMFALMDDSRPDPKTKLYNAPFFNIYADGKVCLGTAPVGKQKAKTFTAEAERFETGFYIAEQNHGHIDNCKRPLKTIWAELIKTKQPFPSEADLLPHKKYKTLGDLINALTSKKTIEDEEE